MHRRPCLFVAAFALAACGASPGAGGAGGEATPAPAVPSSGGPPPEAPPKAGASPESANADGAKTLFVRETRAECEGEGVQKCLQVRERDSDEWTLFYTHIEGFKYEEGTKYELRVAVRKVARPMADASSLRYELVEIVSQQKVQKSP